MCLLDAGRKEELMPGRVTAEGRMGKRCRTVQVNSYVAVQ